MNEAFHPHPGFGPGRDEDEVLTNSSKTAPSWMYSTKEAGRKYGGRCENCSVLNLAYNKNVVVSRF